MSQDDRSSKCEALRAQLEPLCLVPDAPSYIADTLTFLARPDLELLHERRTVEFHRLTLERALSKALGYEVNSVRLVVAADLFRLPVSDPLWDSLRRADFGRQIGCHRSDLWSRLGPEIFLRLEAHVQEAAVKPIYDRLCRRVFQTISPTLDGERDERWLALRDNLWRGLNAACLHFAARTAAGEDDIGGWLDLCGRVSGLIRSFVAGAVPLCLSPDEPNCWLVLTSDDE